jgi:hypothetical protein
MHAHHRSRQAGNPRSRRRRGDVRDRPAPQALPAQRPRRHRIDDGEEGLDRRLRGQGKTRARLGLIQPRALENLEATRMRPDVVSFWHGPLDGLRLTCLRSQVAAGHKVTVYSFARWPACPTASAMPRPKRSCRIRFPSGCVRRSRTAAGATGPFCNSAISSACG